MDPALQLALRAAFALLMATAASHKLRDLARFRETLAGYELLPGAVVGSVAPAVAALEAMLAVALLSGVALTTAGVVTALLLLTYAAAISINVRRGRVDIDCGCMGPASRVPLSPALVVRNLLLASAAVLVVVPVMPRKLEWLDLAGVLASTATLCACWLAGERMLALAPRAATLRGKAS
jgi:hypothetical protein